MYRTSSHDPRYRHSARKGRHVDSRELSEYSTSAEEGDSTDRCTDDSDETAGSLGSESVLKESECSAESGSYAHFRNYPKVNTSSHYLTSHFRHAKIMKHDKVTQKNLLSPFPSFTIPPIYKELSGPPIYKVTSKRPTREMQTEMASPGRPPKHISRSQESFEDDDDSSRTCCVHKKCDRLDKKAFEKQRSQKEQSRCNRAERILTCVNGSKVAEVSGSEMQEVRAKAAAQFPQQMAVTSARRQKATDSDKMVVQDVRGKSRMKPPPTACSTAVRQGLQEDAVQTKGGARERKSPGGNTEVKEKLVYVVEEKGKDVTKLETDLFTLNEILTIKKDLLELSEFAKKLKRLKEMKKESEDGRTQANPCNCQTAAELLKDVNKRIEALETRQEELEKGAKVVQKLDVESDLKKITNSRKTSSESHPKGAVASKTSAVTTDIVFPKMETIVSRDDISNNSDIVNELMDIKTQLHKLEQKRTAKADSEAVLPPDDPKPIKDDAAIAVFSSRTYILTDFEKKKEETKGKGEEKGNNYCSATPEESSKETTKEHVENWLKSVSPKNAVSVSGQKKEESQQREKNKNADIKCKNCWQPLNAGGNEKQEPKKNRATEKDGKRSDRDFAKAEPNKKQINQPMKYKECIVTPSGKIFACLNNSNGIITGASPQPCSPNVAPSPKPAFPSPPTYRTESSFSIPSAMTAKEQVRKVKGDKKRYRNSLLPKRNSKSMQELSVSSTVCKKEKTARNTKLKNKPPPVKDKKHKDSKNQFLKLLESHLLALTKSLGKGNTSSSSCTYSELLASINLDTATTSQTLDSSRLQGSGDNKAAIFAYAATQEDDEDVQVDNCELERRRKRMMKEEQKRRKRRESECKKALMKKIKEQKKCDSLENKKKKQKLKCELKKLKQKCRELNHCSALEECVALWKTSKSLEECIAAKTRAMEECPKKLKSSEDSACKKSVSSEDSGLKKKHRFEEEKHLLCEKDIRKQGCDLKCFSKRYPCETDCARRHRCDEDSSGRHRCDDECPKKRRCDEECPKRHRCDDECGHKRRCCEEETSRRPRCEVPCAPKYRPCEEERDRRRRRHEEESPPKRSLPNCIPQKRYFQHEVYRQCSEEKSTTSQCEKSEDSLQLHKKRQAEKQAPKYPREKPSADESCRLKNIVKNIGKLRINFPFAGEFCDGKHEKCKRSTPEKFISKEEKKRDEKRTEERLREEKRRDSKRAAYEANQWEFDPSNDEEDEDDDEDEEYDDEYYNSREKRQYLSGAEQACPQLHQFASRSEHLRNCKCVRVFMQAQEQRGWSGLRPFQKISSDSEKSEVTSSKTTETYKTHKSDFVFPKMQPQIFQVAHSCDRKKKKHKKKHKKCGKKHKKHRKKHRKLDEDHCRCKKCGNIHLKGCQEEPVKCEENPCQTIPGCSPLAYKSHLDVNLPLFSFFSQFCKPKPRKGKSSRFSLGKIDEVRYLKTCDSRRKKSKSSCCQNPGGKENNCNRKDCEGNQCKCKPRLESIENRLYELENTHEEERKKKKKKKKKHKKDRCCRCSNCESHSTECSEDEGHRKKRKRKCCASDCHECKEKKKKKRSDTCCMSDCDECKCKKKKHKKRKKKHKHSGYEIECNEKPCETTACFQTLYCPSVGESLNSTSRTTKVSSLNDKESTLSTESKDRCAEKGPPKERMSSLHSFWRNLCKYKLGKPAQMENFMKKFRGKKMPEEFTSEIGEEVGVDIGEEPVVEMLDDCSRSSPCPKLRQVIGKTEKPRCFENRKEKKDERRKIMHAKKEAKKNEKPHTKSQPSRNRHK